MFLETRENNKIARLITERLFLRKCRSHFADSNTNLEAFRKLKIALGVLQHSFIN